MIYTTNKFSIDIDQSVKVKLLGRISRDTIVRTYNLTHGTYPNNITSYSSTRGKNLSEVLHAIEVPKFKGDSTPDKVLIYIDHLRNNSIYYNTDINTINNLKSKLNIKFIPYTDSKFVVEFNENELDKYNISYFTNIISEFIDTNSRFKTELLLSLFYNEELLEYKEVFNKVKSLIFENYEDPLYLDSENLILIDKYNYDEILRKLKLKDSNIYLEVPDSEDIVTQYNINTYNKLDTELSNIIKNFSTRVIIGYYPDRKDNLFESSINKVNNLLNLCESVTDTIDDKVKLATKVSNVIILCGSITDEQLKKKTSITLLYNSIKDLGIKVNMLNPNDIYLDEGDENYYLVKKDGTKIRINPSSTFVFYRRSSPESAAGFNLLQRLELLGFICINPVNSINLCNDKYLTYTKLIENKLPTPKTILVTKVSKTEDLKELIKDELGTKYPLIIKVLEGSQGKGVVIAESENSLISTVQALLLTNPKGVLIQEFIENTGDYRVHVVNNKVVTSMKRESGKSDEFRANVSLGGKGKVEELSQDIIDLAIRANKIAGCIWSGVDIIVDKASGKPYVVEINASPGLVGITETRKQNIVKMIIDQLEYTNQVNEISIFEKVTIEGIGEFEALFDTGNMKSSMSLDAKDIKVSDDEKTVTYKVNGKEFTDKLVKFIRVKDNNFSDKSFKRPVIMKNIIFKNRIYNDIMIDLNDRSHKNYKVLVNLDFMKLANVIIKVKD